MKLASQGLPTSGGIGYEIFDKKDIGISDFVQQVNYRRALEGELSRTIMNIQGIIQARVHIVIPQERLFKEDQNEPTASIVLKLQPTVNLRAAESLPPKQPPHPRKGRSAVPERHDLAD